MILSVKNVETLQNADLNLFINSNESTQITTLQIHSFKSQNLKRSQNFGPRGHHLTMRTIHNIYYIIQLIRYSKCRGNYVLWCSKTHYFQLLTWYNIMWILKKLSEWVLSFVFFNFVYWAGIWKKGRFESSFQRNCFWSNWKLFVSKP